MKILLTHDGSVMADIAAPRVEALARALGPQTEVVALCITSSHATPESEEAIEASKSLDRIGRAFSMEGAGQVSPLLLAGEPGPLIVETAERLGCDLIAMSTAGHAGPKQFLGSVADYVARNSHRIPVMLCRPESGLRPLFKKFLLPLDGSTANSHAIQQTQALASAAGASVVLLRLVDSAEQVRSVHTPAGYALGHYILPDADLGLLLEREQENAKTELDADAKRMGDLGLAGVSTIVAEGTPGDSIVAQAEQLGCDVIVMSSHGRGRRDGARVLGSVADHVLQHVAEGAVLLVPPTENGAVTS